MPRRKAAIKRTTLPDPLYGSERLARFINVVMRAGKRSLAERIVYTAIQEASKRLSKKGAKPSGSSKDRKDEDTGESGGSGILVSVDQAKSSGAIEVLEKALNNIRPTVEVKSRRVGGATYQVPIEVDIDRGLALAMRWIVKIAKGRSEKTMTLRLAAEVFEAFEGRGASVKMRDDMHRMAKANQAFAHYRW